MTKITGGRKISLIKEVSDILKVDIGDKIIFYIDDGKIIIEKA